MAARHGSSDVELRHDRGVRRLALAPGDAFLAALAEPSTLHVWSVDGGAPARARQLARRDPQVALAADGERVATAHPDGTVRVTRTADASPVLTVEATRPRAVALDAHGRLVVSTDDETVVWSTEAGAEIAKVQVGFPTGRVAFGPDDRLLAKGSERTCVLAPDGTVTAIPDEPHVFDAHIGPAGIATVANITYGSEGTSGDHDLRLWDLDGLLLQRHARADHTTFALDGHRIADADGNTIEIRDVASGELIHRLDAAPA